MNKRVKILIALILKTLLFCTLLRAEDIFRYGDVSVSGSSYSYFMILNTEDKYTSAIVVSPNETKPKEITVISGIKGIELNLAGNHFLITQPLVVMYDNATKRTTILSLNWPDEIHDRHLDDYIKDLLTKENKRQSDKKQPKQPKQSETAEGLRPNIAIKPIKHNKP